MIQEVWGKQGQLKRLLIVAQGSYKAFIRKTTPKVANQSCARMQNGLCVKSEKCSTLNPFFKISFEVYISAEYIVEYYSGKLFNAEKIQVLP